MGRERWDKRGLESERRGLNNVGDNGKKRTEEKGKRREDLRGKKK